MGVIPVSDPTESTITSQVLSKNAQKRLKKKEEREKTKEDWKKKQREKRKAAKQRRRENASETGTYKLLCHELLSIVLDL